MRNLIAVILYTYLLGKLPNVIVTGDALIFALYVRDLQCGLWIAYGFSLIPAKRILERTLCLIFFIYVAVEAQQYFVYIAFDYGIYSSTYFIYTVILLTLFMFNLLKRYEYPSDKIEDDNKLYLCFYHPKTTLTLFGSTFGFPVGGLSIYCKGTMYGFKFNQENYTGETFHKETIQKKYIVHKTSFRMNKKVMNMLVDLRNKKAGWLRIRCIYTIKDVLNLMGKTYAIKSVFDYIPSRYFKRILG